MNTSTTLVKDRSFKSFTSFLFLAEPFGFGPISSCVAVARQIKILDDSKKCVFLGCGTSYQLANKSDVFDKIYSTEDFTRYELPANDPFLDITNCLVVANTYPTGVEFAKHSGLPCVFIDTLFWMWNELPVQLSDVMGYFIEDFHCKEAPIERFGYSEKMKKFPPLIDVGVTIKTVPHPFLLVTLGGIDSNLYDFPVFYEKLISNISGEKKLENYTILICGGGKRFKNEEFKKYENERVKIACLGPQEFIPHLKAADLVIASAGVHGFYENYFLKKNVMFLPPQSYSQYLQLKYIKDNFENVIGINFEDLGQRHCLRESMPDEERIREVKRTNQFFNDEQVFERFKSILEDFFTGKLVTDWSSEKHRLNQKEHGPLLLAEQILTTNHNYLGMSNGEKLGFPSLPISCPGMSTDRMSLAENVEYWKMHGNVSKIQEAIWQVFDKWHTNPDGIEPLSILRDILDGIRYTPRGDERAKSMTTYVQTLARPEIFSTLLDMLCESSEREGTEDQILSQISQKSTKHAVYGWCGQTRLILSRTTPTHSTLKGEPHVQEYLGKTPTSAWSLSMHIWQPNLNATGFKYGNENQQNIIVEPPHSHPFDFASTIVIGTMHQSIYAQVDSELAKGKTQDKSGRYDSHFLEHVHGVWPPHNTREKSAVVTLEDRVLMNAGDSYFMSADTIHDVQVDIEVAKRQPAITLFLRSESYVKPHVYMAPSMADFHDKNPGLKNQGSPLLKTDWLSKLELVADYVRRKNEFLDLSDIVKYDNRYAFFHV